MAGTRLPVEYELEGGSHVRSCVFPWDNLLDLTSIFESPVGSRDDPRRIFPRPPKRDPMPPSTTAVEAHQVSEVEQNMAALRAVAAGVQAAMGRRVLAVRVAHDAPIPKGAKKVHFIRHGEGQCANPPLQSQPVPPTSRLPPNQSRSRHVRHWTGCSQPQRGTARLARQCRLGRHL